MSTIEIRSLAVIGLGYVGMPLLEAFSQFYDVVGYDLSKQRIDSLLEGLRSKQKSQESSSVKKFTLTSEFENLKKCDAFIIAVPTPLGFNNEPDLMPLLDATRTAGRAISRNSVVIFESTVFPGCTEEICIPLLEKVSGLRVNIDFLVGYSPERINPGDQTKDISNVIKITSGSNEEARLLVDELYREIVPAGTHSVSSLKVAEASKLLENIQRDVNIAMMNEMSTILSALDINTNEVISAASTKWNFSPYYPGLVGGHCIGVDTEYLLYKCRSIGVPTDLLSQTRLVNEAKISQVANKIIHLVKTQCSETGKNNILILGATFKENVDDFRNSKNIELARLVSKAFPSVIVHDPYYRDEAPLCTDLCFTNVMPNKIFFDAIVLAVPHKEYLQDEAVDFSTMLRSGGVFVDLRSALPRMRSSYSL